MRPLRSQWARVKGGRVVSSWECTNEVAVGTWVTLDEGTKITYQVAEDGEDVEFFFGGQHKFDLMTTTNALRDLVRKGIDALLQADTRRAEHAG